MNRMLQQSKGKINKLQNFINSNHEGKPVLRAVIILLSYFMEAKKIQKIIGIALSTIYDRVNKYKIEDIESFNDKKRPGRPINFKIESKKVLIEMVSESPMKQGYSWNNWTCKTLKIQISLTIGITVSEETIRSVLHEYGKSWKKPRYKVESPDPEKEIKLAKIEEIKNNLKSNEVVLYEDESDFNLFCYLRNCWQNKGKGSQIEVETPRKNQKVYAFGSLEKQTNKLIYGVFKRKRAKEFILFLRHILNVYEGKKIYMILDNSSMHKAKILTKFIENNKNCLELLFLPTYNPENNPIERVWGTVKGWVNSNYLYPDKDSLVIGVRSGLRRYQQETRLAYAA